MRNKKIIITIILIMIALVSLFNLSGIFSSVEFNASNIAFLDDKKMDISKIVLAATAASVAIGAVPGDSTTPIATEIAEITTWLLVVTCIVIAEKYLLTISGYISFSILIPVACLLGIISLYVNNNFYRSLSIKLALFSIVLVLIVPTSIKVTQLIESTYQESINQTMEVIENEITIEENSKPNIFGQIIDNVQNITNDTINKVKNSTSKFIDAVAVMVVTTCIIPVLVLLGFIWLVKIIFKIEIPRPKRLLNPLNKDKVKSIENKSEGNIKNS